MGGWESHHIAFQAAADRKGGLIALVVDTDMVSAVADSCALATRRASRIVIAGSCADRIEDWVGSRRSGGRMEARDCTCLRRGLFRPCESVGTPYL